MATRASAPQPPYHLPRPRRHSGAGRSGTAKVVPHISRTALLRSGKSRSPVMARMASPWNRNTCVADRKAAFLQARRQALPFRVETSKYTRGVVMPFRHEARYLLLRRGMKATGAVGEPRRELAPPGELFRDAVQEGRRHAGGTVPVLGDMNNWGVGSSSNGVIGYCAWRRRHDERLGERMEMVPLPAVPMQTIVKYPVIASCSFASQNGAWGSAEVGRAPVLYSGPDGRYSDPWEIGVGTFSQLPPPPSVRSSRASNRVSPAPMVSSNTALKPDHVGIVVLHIYGANDLPKWPNMTRTGWDMDPFVKVSIGEQVKSTEVIQHKLDPVWDKELLFHVRQQDLQLPIRLAIFDWDRFTPNDLVGWTEINVATLVERAANRDPNTGLYPVDLPSVLYFNGLRLTKNPDPSRAYTRTPTITFQNRRSRDYDTDYTQAISRRAYINTQVSWLDAVLRDDRPISASPPHKSHASARCSTPGRRDGEFPKGDDAKVRALQATGQ
ncbi:hypothetical protein EDB89DRAFT_1905100 [Lactarius sanguifluus]|nr:hypothetical protein EDB89DRAFT_1905100 [Lactarius sanguifluus]